MQIVVQVNAVVRVWTARSQSVRAMGKAEFKESVDKVLAFCADWIGVAPMNCGKRRRHDPHRPYVEFDKAAQVGMLSAPRARTA